MRTTVQEPVDIADLVREHLPLVRCVVAELAARLPRHVDREDLVAAGHLGLVQAAQAYRPERAVPFARFATLRIRGALLDELRGRDWASRSVRRRGRLVTAATERLRTRLGRSPTAAEVAAETGLSLAQLQRLSDDVDRAATVTLDGVLDESGGEGVPVEDDVASRHVLDREELGYLADAVLQLPERLRRVVVGSFFEERTLRQLADELGVTESRVCQLRGEAIELLRDGLRANLDVPDTANLDDARSRRARRSCAYRAAVAGSSDYRFRLDGTPVLRRLALAGAA